MFIYRLLGCELYLFCLMSWCFLLLCMVIFKHELIFSTVDVSYALDCEGGLRGGFAFASEDLMDFPSLK